MSHGDTEVRSVSRTHGAAMASLCLIRQGRTQYRRVELMSVGPVRHMAVANENLVNCRSLQLLPRPLFGPCVLTQIPNVYQDRIVQTQSEAHCGGSL